MFPGVWMVIHLSMLKCLVPRGWGYGIWADDIKHAVQSVPLPASFSSTNAISDSFSFRVPSLSFCRHAYFYNLCCVGIEHCLLTSLLPSAPCCPTPQPQWGKDNTSTPGCALESSGKAQENRLWRLLPDSRNLSRDGDQGSGFYDSFQ